MLRSTETFQKSECDVYTLLTTNSHHEQLSNGKVLPFLGVHRFLPFLGGHFCGFMFPIEKQNLCHNSFPLSIKRVPVLATGPCFHCSRVSVSFTDALYNIDQEHV